MCHTLASDSAGGDMSGKRKENHCKHEQTGLRMGSTDSMQGNSASSIVLPHLVFCYVVIDLCVSQRSSLVSLMIIHPHATHSCITIGLGLLRYWLAGYTWCVEP